LRGNSSCVLRALIVALFASSLYANLPQRQVVEVSYGYDERVAVSPCVRCAVAERPRHNCPESKPAPLAGFYVAVQQPPEEQKFTSKERDAETGLDYFGARYFSGAQGRFTSPDPPLLDQSRLLNAGELSQRQTWASRFSSALAPCLRPHGRAVLIPRRRCFPEPWKDCGLTGIASPINRTNPGFVGGGRTAGGAREFVIPNGGLPPGVRIRVVR
jgi:RHS repeat-associated protein